MKKISVQPNGKRVWAGFRRVGRPKLKWYEVVRSATIDKLTNLDILHANWKNEMSEIEMLQMIIDTAHDRDSNILLYTTNAPTDKHTNLAPRAHKINRWPLGPIQ